MGGYTVYGLDLAF